MWPVILCHFYYWIREVLLGSYVWLLLVQRKRLNRYNAVAFLSIIQTNSQHYHYVNSNDNTFCTPSTKRESAWCCLFVLFVRLCN